ncbi:MAG: hypothetical protein HYY18_20865 [Planctomycetes bacterium]|nr:hypothetical protein [Planctomycetota bacterium]
MIRILILFAAAILLAGCAGGGAPEPIPDDHPANPAAPEADSRPVTQAFSGEEKREAKPPAAEEYACPMHPEVRQKEPGKCPKCGMALEPVRGKEHEHR